MSMLLTIVACLLIAGAAIIGLGVLLLPFYAWAWWRTEATLREARDAGLLEYRVTNASRQEPGSAGHVANPARPLARLAAYETARQKQNSTSERCFLNLHCWRKRRDSNPR